MAGLSEGVPCIEVTENAYISLRSLTGRYLQVTGWGLPELSVSEVLAVAAEVQR